MKDLIVGLLVGFATGLGLSGLMAIWGLRSIVWALQPLLSIVAGIEDEEPVQDVIDSGGRPVNGLDLGPKRF